MTAEEPEDSQALLGATDWLRGLTRGLAGSAAEGDELYQSTVVAAWDEAQNGGSTSRAWLAGTVRRKLARCRRDRSRRARRERAGARAEALPSTVELVERGELHRHVVRAVLGLPEPYRETILQRFWEDLPPRQVAARSGTPVETVRTRLKRGLAMLRDRLDASCGSRGAWLAPLANWADLGLRPGMAGSATHGAWLVGAGAIGVVALLASAIGFPGGVVETPAPVTSSIPTRVSGDPARYRTAPTDRMMRREAVMAEFGPAAVATTDQIRTVTRLAHPLSRASELTALDLMEAIVRAQNQWRSEVTIDADFDGTGEHGYLAELAGRVSMRAAPAKRRRLLSLRLGEMTDGIAEASGYCFRMYLPGVHGTPLAEADGGGVGDLLPDPDLAEQIWCCYAWPAVLPRGVPARVLFVDQQGRVLAADNHISRYVGRALPPLPNAAYQRGTAGRLGDSTADGADDGRGGDGQVWRIAARPAATVTRVRIVDEVGNSLPGVRVRCAQVDGTGQAQSLSSQTAALGRLRPGGVLLPAAGSGTTDENGVVELNGLAVLGVFLAVQRRDGEAPELPTLFSFEDGALRVQVSRPQPEPGKRFHANESAAIATLKNIASAQAQCQASCVIDENTNGAGEFGYFGELSGATVARAAPGVDAVRMSPPVLSAAFGVLQTDAFPRGGVVRRSGYYFELYLPTAAAIGVSERPTGVAGARFLDPSLAELVWCCYAWPIERGTSGRRAFFVNQCGDVLACGNELAQYSGTWRAPRATAAFSRTAAGGMADQTATNGLGFDGGRWFVVN